LPPQIDTNSLDPTDLPASEFPQFEKFNDRRNAFSAESEEVRTKGFLPPPTGFEPPRILPNHNQQFRSREEERLKNLGLPLQASTQATRSKSRPSVQNVQQQNNNKPGRTFDPEKNFAAFDHFFPSGKATHKDYDFSRFISRKDGVATTRKPTTRQQNFNSRFNNNNNNNNNFNNQLPIGPPTTQRPSAFRNAPTTKAPTVKTTTPQRRIVASPTIAATARPVTNRPATIATTKKPNQQIQQQQQQQQQQPKSSFNSNSNNNQQQQQIQPNLWTPQQQQLRQQQKAIQAQLAPKSKVQSKVPSVPSTNLEPPFEVLRIYDDATTQGPPIYYEWKVPDDFLLPPKFDNDNDTNSLKRSVLEEGNFDGSNDFQSSETRRIGKGSSPKIQYKDLQRLFAIPDVELPLESNGPSRYDNADAVNSFQVKIPYRKSNAKSSAERYYYLEQSACNPECHPYFFKPGRCEPCIKISKRK
jgi:hypothetical protein